MDMRDWMAAYVSAMLRTFGDRVRFIGLQGSRGRGEAGPDSDIDVVLILDRLAPTDLAACRAAAADLPERDKLCGFVSGAEELAAWDRGNCFSSAMTPRMFTGAFPTCCRRKLPATPADPFTPGPAAFSTSAATTASMAAAWRRRSVPARARYSSSRPRRMWRRGSTTAGTGTWKRSSPGRILRCSGRRKPSGWAGIPWIWTA